MAEPSIKDCQTEGFPISRCRARTLQARNRSVTYSVPSTERLLNAKGFSRLPPKSVARQEALWQDTLREGSVRALCQGREYNSSGLTCHLKQAVRARNFIMKAKCNPCASNADHTANTSFPATAGQPSQASRASLAWKLLRYALTFRGLVNYLSEAFPPQDGSSISIYCEKAIG